jgi:WD40 repeat protein
MMYDAFLSYNTKDRDAVEAIAFYLKDKAGLKVFFDRWEMIPGTPVQETLEKALAESAACVVFIGPPGLGIYQNEETRIALEKSISKKELRVIPVLLPGGKRETKESELPPFLRRLSWVEFDDDPLDPDSLRRLECGIKNISPGPGGKPLDPQPGICPYRGLEVFREQDRAFFFGRESLVQRLMARLKSDRFLAFIGPSGSGKSSVLQAGLIPLLRFDSLIALFTPRERPLEELALALRRAAAPNQLPYSTAQIVDQFNHSTDSLHYLAREILQLLPVDGSKPVQRFVVIVDQFEEIFTLSQSEPERQQFISLLLRAVEMVGGPVTVILAMRSDFIGKCAPYRDLNIYCSEHLEQVEPMTRDELQSAIESPAHSVGLEFEDGLVGVMLEDVKGSGSELPLIGHALWELFHYQPRQGNRLTAQAYEAIGRIEGALVRRAESLYNGLTVSQQETLRKMFLLGLIQPGEGVPDTRRRAMKEELLAIGGDAEAAEKLIYELATARLLTVGRDEAAGQDTVEVAHEALIRNWARIGAWMAEGREIARQRGLLRQAAREWEKSGKNPEYLFHGTRLAQMEEFVTAHGQDLGTLEKEFIAAGTTARKAQRRKKRRNFRAFISALIAVLLVVISLWYWADRSEKKALKQLAVNYCDTARRMREDKNNLKALHLFCEALSIEKDKRLRGVLLTDMNELWKTPMLLHIFPHKKGINEAKFSKDESRIITWSWDDAVHLYDAATGKPIGDFIKHEKEVTRAIFNNDGTRILTWNDDGSVRLWDTATGKPIGEAMKHPGTIKGAIFNQDVTRILTWSDDGTALLWDAAKSKPIGEFMKHMRRVYNPIFNKNRIITWINDKTIRLWDAVTGTPIGEVMMHEGSVFGAIFNKNETCILTWSGDGTARLWDAATGKSVGEVMKHEGPVNGAVFNKDETRILTWSDDCTARLWDAATGKPIGEVIKHWKSVYNAIFNKDESRILTWSGDNRFTFVSLWDADTGKHIKEIWRYRNLKEAIFNQKGTYILTVGYYSYMDQYIEYYGYEAYPSGIFWDPFLGKRYNIACIWDASNGEKIIHDSCVNGASFNQNGNHILTWSDDGAVRHRDVYSGESIGEVMKHDDVVRNAIFNHDETRILTWSDDKTARLWEAATGKSIGKVMKHDGAILGTIFNSDDSRILTWSNDGTARLWDATIDTPTGEFMKLGNYVNGLIFNRDKTRIFAWSYDGTARLWDIATGKPIGVVMKHENEVNGAIFNKDETRILTWSGYYRNGSARLWDAATGKSIGMVMKHENEVNGAIFNKDETRILTWSDDNTARLWDAATCKPFGEVMKHEGDVNGAIYNHDETRILTWSDDKTARLWDAATCKPFDEVMKHEDDVNGAIYNHDETRILTWSGDYGKNGTAQLWDAATGKPIGEVMKHDKDLNDVIFNQDGTLILTLCGDNFSGTARLWDAATGKPFGEVMKHEDEVNGAIFNQDGTRILTWSKDGTARLWDAATGKPNGEFMKHGYSVNCAIFNHAESLILTWSEDGTVRFWDAATGKPIGDVMKHEDHLNGAVFNKDETRILTWSQDGTARLWGIAIDPDFPMEYIKLQVMAITGTSYDTITNTVNVIPPDQWRKLKEQYMHIAAKHYKSCRFPEGNVFRKLFPKEAEKIEREKVRR